MSLFTSVDMSQDNFSPKPFYSIEPPPATDEMKLSSVYPDYAEKTTNYSVSGSSNDPHVVTLRHEDRASGWKNAEAYAILLLGKDQYHDTAPSSFSKHDITFGPASDTALNFLVAMNFFRSFIAMSHNDRIHGFNVRLLSDEWTTLLPLVNKKSQVQQGLDAISLHETSREYYAILSDFLVPLSFSMSDEYEDVFGGKVIDYFRENERVSCIVSIQHVQVLSFLGGNFKEKIFERSGTTKRTVFEYMEKLLSNEENADLDSPKENQS